MEIKSTNATKEELQDYLSESELNYEAINEKNKTEQ